MSLQIVDTFSDTSPASATTAVSAKVVGGMQNWSSISFVATLTGATGGALDVYIQQQIGSAWVDLVHFPQVAAGAAAAIYRCSCFLDGTIRVVGSGTTPALAANTVASGHPGNALRVLYVAGVGTSAGAAQTIQVVGWAGEPK